MPALPVLILVIAAIVIVVAPVVVATRLLGRTEPRRDPAAAIGEPLAWGAMPAR